MDKPGSKHAASISSDRLPYLPGCFPLLRSLREHRIQSPYQPRGCIRLVADYFAPREDGRARSDGEGGTGRAPKIEYFGEKAWWKSSVEMERYASFRRNCF